MARTTIDNGALLSLIRTRLNTMFTELYNSIITSIRSLVYGTPTNNQVIRWDADEGRAFWGDIAFTNRSIENITATTLLVNGTYINKYLDCYSSSPQTLTIYPLGEYHNGDIIIITKFGAGDVRIVLPTGVTWADGTTDDLLISAIGYPCELRYNHTRGVLVYNYLGSIEQVT